MEEKEGSMQIKEIKEGVKMYAHEKKELKLLQEILKK